MVKQTRDRNRLSVRTRSGATNSAREEERVAEGLQSKYCSDQGWHAWTVNEGCEVRDKAPCGSRHCCELTWIGAHRQFRECHVASQFAHRDFRRGRYSSCYSFVLVFSSTTDQAEYCAVVLIINHACHPLGSMFDLDSSLLLVVQNRCCSVKNSSSSSLRQNANLRVLTLALLDLLLHKLLAPDFWTPTDFFDPGANR